MLRVLLSVLLVLALSRPAWAQSPPKASEEPVNITVALVGTVVVGAGFGMMLRQDERGSSDTGWLIGGVAVVAAGFSRASLANFFETKRDLDDGVCGRPHFAGFFFVAGNEV
jgi:hypothetical protein